LFWEKLFCFGKSCSAATVAENGARKMHVTVVFLKRLGKDGAEGVVYLNVGFCV
jgi:hypothetical protein